MRIDLPALEATITRDREAGLPGIAVVGFSRHDHDRRDRSHLWASSETESACDIPMNFSGAASAAAAP
jgi:hypothetical protein